MDASLPIVESIVNYRSLTAAILGGLVTLYITRVCYNTLLHPLSSFPGPMLAAASDWWLVYHEFIRGESLTDILSAQHQKYGAVVRYGPNQLHFSTGQAYLDIYNQASKWNKDPSVYAAVADETSSFGITSYKESKPRREIVQPFYSRRSVLQMQDALHRQTEVLVRKLIEHAKSHQVSNLSLAFRCLAQDVMTDICLGISTDTLHAPDFDSPIINAIDEGMQLFVLLKSFPKLRKVFYSLPPQLLGGEAVTREYESFVARKVHRTVQDPSSVNTDRSYTMLQHLMKPSRSSSNPVLDTQSMIEELQTFIVGGGETVASTITISFSNVLQQPQLYASLRAEIKAAWPDAMAPPPSVEALERLPLLTATIKESLRLAHGVVSPLPRIIPPGGVCIDGQHVPGGTSVGVSHVFIHMSEVLFPQPRRFDPQRWIESSGNGSCPLDRWLVAFSKGPRGCVGISLAWCELYVVFATLIRKFQFDYPKDLNDPEMRWRDCFQALYFGKHLRVRCSLDT